MSASLPKISPAAVAAAPPAISAGLIVLMAATAWTVVRKYGDPAHNTPARPGTTQTLKA